jgi:threonine dehydrogenase-like Zn-dependent dehydrogenase
MQAIRVHQHGGPESMRLEEVPTPAPGPNQALVRLAVAGVNFIDVYFRTGAYKAEQPTALGNEGAGTVEAIGPEVTEVSVGDRVAYAMSRGSYAQYAVAPAASLVKLPDGITFEQAAAAMLQGMTAHYLTRSSFALKAGDTCLVHAAAGGAGLLVVQMAKELGARVFGTVSTEAKARLARDNGADEIIRYTEQDFEVEEPELPAAARDDGALRHVERCGSTLRSGHAQQQGIALPDPSKPRPPRRHTRRARVASPRRPPRCLRWFASSEDRSQVPSRAGCGGAPSAREPGDNGKAAARSPIGFRLQALGFSSGLQASGASGSRLRA